MATYIKTLKEDNGDITYPQTSSDAVLMPTGETLETRISNYVTAEHIAETDPITPTITHEMIQEGAVKSDNIDWTTLWSGEYKNRSTGTSTAITLSEASTNFAYLEFIARNTNWADQDANNVFRHYVNSSDGSCHIMISYAYGGTTIGTRVGTLRISGSSIYWDANRSLAMTQSGTSSNVITSLTDGESISLLKVIGYR